MDPGLHLFLLLFLSASSLSILAAMAIERLDD
jgi:hypothetical protein